MMQAGFSVFFLLLLIAGTAGLFKAAAQNFARIKGALEGPSQAPEAAVEFRLEVRPTGELPRIARRLRIDFPQPLSPAARVPRAWPFERTNPA